MDAAGVCFRQMAQNKSDVKAEQNHIAVLEYVFFALGADQAFFLGGSHRTAGFQIVESYNLRPDKAFFKIRMDFACGLRRFGAFLIVQARTSCLPAVR